MFYRQWEETVVGLKMHIHRKRVQVSRKLLITCAGSKEFVDDYNWLLHSSKNFF